MSYQQFFEFGGLKFYGELTTINRKPSTYKVVVGKKVIEKQVVQRNAFDYNLAIRGYLTGDLNSLTVEQEKDALLALQDAVYHAFTDGEHDGNYIIPDSGLVIDQNQHYEDAYSFTLRLIQWNQ